MNLALTEEQELVRDTFAQLFATESSPERVRGAEPTGFDAALWQQLVETGAIGIRVPEARGGADASLFDAVLLAEQAGRHLLSGPLLESIAVGSALSRLEAAEAHALVASAIEGSRVVSLALRPGDGEPQLVAGGAVADAVVGLDGNDLVIVERAGSAERPDPLANLGSCALAYWNLGAVSGDATTRTVIATGERAQQTFERAREEWRLLMAAALAGLGRRAVEIGAAYASERVQFDRLIGSFQAIAHPLADAAMALDGGKLLVWRAVQAIAEGAPGASSLVPMAFAWVAEAAPRAAHRALHTHGGYGLSHEYDIQLYHRRAKTWALLDGDPRDALLDAADRRWRGQQVALPEAGEVTIDFGLGEKAEEFRLVVRRFLEAHPASEETRAKRHSFDGHDPEFHRLLAREGLLFASWPKEYGGQGRDPFEATALGEEMERAGRTTYTIGNARLVAETLMEFASEEVKRDVLPRIAEGEALCALGYTEPGSGSDVAAAQTRAVRDGDDWVINGQKMFTSSADIADYIFLLTRTNPDAKKHQGLTMFLVPVDTPGIEIQPIYTLSDERTNATYYTDVRIADRFRVGEVDGGWAVVGYALHLEHSAGASGGGGDLERMIETVAAWARERRRGGRPAIEDDRVREVLAYTLAEAEITEALALRGLWCAVEGLPDRAEGAMSAAFKKFSTLDVAARLMDLTAPESVLQRGADGAIEGGALEFGYRLGTALGIYGGTAEILKSIVAQVGLGMPRSRS
jgi:alkylation response protein AidB-like acyl-CoA dehydrogenase